MPLADWAAFKLAYTNPRDTVIGNKGMVVTAKNFCSSWTQGPLNGVAPTASVVHTKTTLGTYPFDNWQDAGSGNVYCLGGDLTSAGSFGLRQNGTFILADRLVHSGGLSGIVTTAQTTNLPTAALTRYTTGVGVLGYLEIYSNIGNTATTVTVSYTNQAATAGKISLAQTFGGNDYNAAPRMVPIPLAAGDTGIRSVQSVTVLATTGTAGNFGVTLVKPIAIFAPSGDTAEQFDPVLSGNWCGIPPIQNGACLQLITMTDGSGGFFNFNAALSFAEIA